MTDKQEDLTKEQWREYAKDVTQRLEAAETRIVELQRSADGAREIAKIAQDANGVRGARALIVIGNGKFDVVVCSPGNDEAKLTRIVAEHLVAAFGITLGIEFKGEVREVGSTV